MTKTDLKNISKAELRDTARQTGTYTRKALGVSPSKANKKQLRNAIAKKVAIAGSLLGAVALASGAVIYCRRTPNGKICSRKIVASPSTKRTTRQFNASSSLKNVVQPTSKEKAEADETLMKDQATLLTICNKNVSQITANDINSLITLSGKYHILNNKNVVSLNPERYPLTGRLGIALALRNCKNLSIALIDPKKGKEQQQLVKNLFAPLLSNPDKSTTEQEKSSKPK